ncbi:SMC-Scp complex subunit ScpB [Patescibacteria group bacterium]|nr:SMC-Scp complex subunit ScpB [Patescibacteria group bacterium]MBU1890941.1 SMC-Scp complex subunit ScpB [Patescibacteria group bacterium]
MKNKIESLLFVTSKPLSQNKIAEILKAETAEVNAAVQELKEDYNNQSRGIQLMTLNTKVQFVTNSDNRAIVEKFLKEEQLGELTKPGLETLTIIAYRGPITKPELEQIRGVNCSMILRNLMIKGLVESQDDKKIMQTIYSVTFDFVRYLGINEVKELPEYDKLSQHETLEKVLSIKPEEQEG